MLIRHIYASKILHWNLQSLAASKEVLPWWNDRFQTQRPLWSEVFASFTRTRLQTLWPPRPSNAFCHHFDASWHSWKRCADSCDPVHEMRSGPEWKQSSCVFSNCSLVPLTVNEISQSVSLFWYLTLENVFSFYQISSVISYMTGLLTFSSNTVNV